MANRRLWSTLWDFQARLPELPGDSVTRLRCFFAYCVGCLLGYTGYWLARTTPGFPWGGPGDFTSFCTGALIFRSGHSQQLYDLVLQASVQRSLLRPYGWIFKDGLLPYIYPPFFAPLIIPLSYLPLGVAFHVWNLISLAFLLASVKVLLNQQHRGTSRDFLVAGLVVLSFFPVFEAFYKGQSVCLVLFAFALAYVNLKRGHEGWAGVALAIGLIKPQLVVFVALVLLTQRRWRAILSLGGAGLLLAGLSWVLVGTQGMKAYASLSRSVMMWNGLYNFLPTRMANVRGTVYRFARAFELVGGAEPAAWVLLLATVGCSAILLVLILRCWKGGWRPTGATFDLKFAFTLIGTLLLTPYLYGHDLSLLVLAGFIILGALNQLGEEPSAQALLAAGHMAFMIAFFFGGAEGGAQVMMIALLAAMGYLARTLKGNSKEAACESGSPGTGKNTHRSWQ